MPTIDPIAAARREAKARVRRGGATHQQALDAIAREAGHAHWGDMHQVLRRAARDPVRAFVEDYRHEDADVDDEVRALLEDAIHGWIADGRPAIADHVESYEFRGDGFDLTPDERQRAVMTAAITLFSEAHPAAPATLADVERRTVDLMKEAKGRPGLPISDWVSERMRAAASRATARTGDRRGHGIRPIPMDAVMMAQAVDPDGGPFAMDARGVVHARCPVDEDGSASLVIGGAGAEVGFRCMAGCPHPPVDDAMVSGLTRAAADAVAFMAANDASPVVEGWGRGAPGVGGRGGFYRLEDGRVHELTALSCRMLQDGYPRWTHDPASGG